MTSKHFTMQFFLPTLFMAVKFGVNILILLTKKLLNFKIEHFASFHLQISVLKSIPCTLILKLSSSVIKSRCKIVYLFMTPLKRYHQFAFMNISSKHTKFTQLLLKALVLDVYTSQKPILSGMVLILSPEHVSPIGIVYQRSLIPILLHFLV